MGGIEVASVVSSIIAAFGSGLDLFHRLGGKRRKNKARLPRPAEEEEWLRQSLSNRPVEIRREYDQQLAKYGRPYELGDGAAQSSLAHTLLVLNTGLINMINRALSGDSKTVSASQRALYHLSETAAVDTMTALAQLSSRLSLAAPSRLALESKEHRRNGDKHSHRERRSVSPPGSKQLSRPPPTPLLARGGWVRSASGSSVVSKASARKAHREHGEKHRRSKSDSAVTKHSSLSSDRHKASRNEVAGTGSDPMPTTNEGVRRPTSHRSSERMGPQRQPSMLIVPADFFNQVEYISDKPTPQNAPARPPKVPLPSDPVPSQRRTRPISTMTFMTTSTKIGEIPESRFHSKEEVLSRPLPYIIPPPLEPLQPKKKKGLKFWKRDEKRHDIAAY